MKLWKCNRGMSAHNQGGDIAAVQLSMGFSASLFYYTNAVVLDY